jgi:fluoride ion exporter CrcB/FEX
MVQDKKNYELLYARTVINLMANQSLRTFMSTNLLDYYANNRLIALQSTITEMVGAFTTVNRFVVEGTRMCSM